MVSFWKAVNEVIERADVLLMLLDARLIHETRNDEIEMKVAQAKKPLIYVITKSDLADQKVLERYKSVFIPSVFVSAKEHHGTTMLRDRILIEAKKAGINKQVWVGVLGYPNVGKSSLINAMKGRHSAPTSIMSGYTKGIQKIKADNRIMFLDSPGVIPYREKDPLKHSIIGTLDFTKVKEPDLTVMKIMEEFPGVIEKFYKVKVIEDFEETIEAIAQKKNILKKGGEPDMMRMSRMIIKDWQKGVIRAFEPAPAAKVSENRGSSRERTQ